MSLLIVEARLVVKEESSELAVVPQVQNRNGTDCARKLLRPNCDVRRGGCVAEATKVHLPMQAHSRFEVVLKK